MIINLNTSRTASGRACCPESAVPAPSPEARPERKELFRTRCHAGRGPAALGLAMAVFAAALPVEHAAAAWPDRAIRLVVPFPAGGGPELMMRALTRELGSTLGQPVILDYRPGANNLIGAAEAARAEPDGYTWMIAPEAVFTINPHVYKSLGFDPAKLQPVSLIGSFINVLSCNPALGVKTVEDLVVKARAVPLAYASSGVGSPNHMTMEMFLAEAKAKMSHIPYKGPMPAVQDLLGGHVDCSFLVESIAVEHIKEGSLVALAGSGKRPSGALAELPTLASAGYPGFDATFWLGVFGRADVDPEVFERFSSALHAGMQSPDVRNAMLTQGTTPAWVPAEQASAEIQHLKEHWGEVAQRIDLKAE